MAEGFTIEKRDNYIYVRIEAEQASAEFSRRFFGAIAQACQEHNCYNILGESFATKPMSTTEAFEHAEIFREVGITPRHRLAWVTHAKPVADQARFVEMVLKNRGLVTGFLFDTMDEACDWLLGQHQPVDQ